MKIDKALLQSVKSGAVGVIPTDTIYGVIASVKFPQAIETVYKVKRRPRDQACIVLIHDVSDLKILNVYVDPHVQSKLLELWEHPISVILPSTQKTAYTHQVTNTVAVRLPKPAWLREVISVTGPLVATSANLSGSPILSDIDEIKKQLPGLEFYIEGPVSAAPSKLTRLREDYTVEWLNR